MGISSLGVSRCIRSVYIRHFSDGAQLVSIGKVGLFIHLFIYNPSKKKVMSDTAFPVSLDCGRKGRDGGGSVCLSTTCPPCMRNAGGWEGEEEGDKYMYLIQDF